MTYVLCIMYFTWYILYIISFILCISSYYSMIIITNLADTFSLSVIYLLIFIISVLPVSVGQEPRVAWLHPLSLESLTRLQWRQWPGLESHVRVWQWKDPHPSSCGLAVFSFLLAGSWRQSSAPAMWPLHKAAHSRAACFLRRMTRKP